MDHASNKVSTQEIEKQKGFLNEVNQQNKNKNLKYIINTFGCQMNENESERLAGMLKAMGYTATDNREESDIVIFNTCCVRENAELKVYGHLGALKEIKEKNPDLIIAVCGCMMQQKEVVDFIKKKYRHVDIVFGTHNQFKFPELVYKALTTKGTFIDVWETAGLIAESMPIERNEGTKAWVTVMYGCNNFCSYCIVPYVRGRERSREISDIVDEVKELASKNYKEITLLGQNVNSYGKDLGDEIRFADLLREINKIDGIERIRFMTSHPKDLSDELVCAIRDCEKVCEHLHLPIQSGSSNILKEMNRKYTKEYYFGLSEKIRSNIPDIALSTDIIVGFPGETEEDFEETLDVVKKVRFDSVYMFLYSKRTGTPAAKNEAQIPDDVMKNRFDRLVEVQNQIGKEKNDKLLGMELEVLVEGLSKNNEDIYTGRTRTNKIINFKGSEDLIGKLVTVKIEKIHTWSLAGSVV